VVKDKIGDVQRVIDEFGIRGGIEGEEVNEDGLPFVEIEEFENDFEQIKEKANDNLISISNLNQNLKMDSFDIQLINNLNLIEEQENTPLKTNSDKDDPISISTAKKSHKKSVRFDNTEMHHDSNFKKCNESVNHIMKNIVVEKESEDDTIPKLIGNQISSIMKKNIEKSCAAVDNQQLSSNIMKNRVLESIQELPIPKSKTATGKTESSSHIMKNNVVENEIMNHPISERKTKIPETTTLRQNFHDSINEGVILLDSDDESLEDAVLGQQCSIEYMLKRDRFVKAGVLYDSFQNVFVCF
jgi:hypothetical protein